MIDNYRGKWKYDWEEPYLESTRSEPFVSTFADIEYMLEKIGDLGTRFECEAYDVGHLYTLARFLDRGLAKPWTGPRPFTSRPERRCCAWSGRFPATSPTASRRPSGAKPCIWRRRAEATAEDIDVAIAHGPSLRWAIMGPCLTFHLAGGEGGMGAMLDHFGPALKEPWTRLAAPPLTAALRDQLIAGCRREAAGRDIADLVRERDAGLAGILRALDGRRG